MTNHENIPQMEIVREFKNKYGREIALMLISERINNRNLSKEDRDIHEMQLLQAYMDRQGMNDKYIGELDILDMVTDFERMIKMSVNATNILTVLGTSGNEMQNEISYFSREDDLNNLYLAKLEIEKLIKAIEKNRPNYINFYK
ncbi:hypothetical protein [Staphylococcus saprophyticus]|uniref:hypothetical protein n=1 Tax=Staphylococcus saprophyticus TaxID=29385 RepID=UPI0009BCE343|nr:hypothetical protein [Staphylococcus saprophyticus]MCM3121012.1 hypothetical protein [Staphylococcus saprophyticus]MDW3923028.1 hypothetical protein [Staphylococcus saprophyticus]MDW3972470.1 hypothetical protein [Staphylococcus saprophyticus]MDW4020876.1 hypothetical protein [Staphylococcus saprophyticus]MDW4048039.1 hypothetical protein [Staphylococcus saprophyticus]